MKDIQSEIDTREIPLQKVGVRGVKYPVCVLDKTKKTQNTTACVDLFVNLPHNFKGTHMSRFIQIFHKYHKDLTIKHFLLMLEEIRTKLDAQKAYGLITFPYYVEKLSPVTKTPGLMQYICSYEGEVCKTENKDNDSKFFVTIKVPLTTLCPCSKAISQNSAHNQRGTVSVKLLYKDFFWIEDVISVIEDCASSPLYTALKRQDEKYVTEQAYEKPRFVEDVVREVYIVLKNMGFTCFSVEAENEESIHLHNAYAYTEYSKEK